MLPNFARNTNITRCDNDILHWGDYVGKKGDVSVTISYMSVSSIEHDAKKNTYFSTLCPNLAHKIIIARCVNNIALMSSIYKNLPLNLASLRTLC